MGCDIHLQLETKSGEHWRIVRPAPWRPWPFPKGADGKMIWPDNDPTSRNYRTFGFLADVRNNEDIEPQFADRGLPVAAHAGEQMRREVLAENADYDLGDHSFTWATIAELWAAQWGQVRESSGWIKLDPYIAWRDAGAIGPPDSWSQSVSGGFVEHWDRAAADALVSPLPAHKRGYIYVQISWTWQPLLDSGFHRWLFGDQLRAIVEGAGGPEQVRLLMGFDS